ncbi:DUF4883 family protein [Inconstantimicrobium mannanitabidum]|uniref:Lipoprotein n=1 Tax=Inconstantimicrobium mannanitabidum TaxID=1604901 RepID=A0ACB5RC86_9CLOT|nr:DUF4883 family protein [Clostridium sp. TW13]GKX66848.1 lipoprotein [Clostridium sp. TW13]
MKKLFYCLIVIFSIVTLEGCSNTKFISFEKKPSNSYYCDELSNLINSNSYNLKILDLNMYKQKEISNEEKKVLIDFFKHMDKKKNIITNTGNDISNEKIQYKMFIEANSQKYVINIYNDKYCAVHPWDGEFVEDYIDSDGIPRNYNLYGFCKYIFREYL